VAAVDRRTGSNVVPTACHFVARPKYVHLINSGSPPLANRELVIGTIKSFFEVTFNGRPVILAKVDIYTSMEQQDEWPHLWTIRRCTTVPAVLRAAHLGDPVALGRGAPWKGWLSTSFWTVIPCVPTYEADCTKDDCYCNGERKTPEEFSALSSY
jgi:hypothetical protein